MLKSQAKRLLCIIIYKCLAAISSSQLRTVEMLRQRNEINSNQDKDTEAMNNVDAVYTINNSNIFIIPGGIYITNKQINLY